MASPPEHPDSSSRPPSLITRMPLSGARLRIIRIAWVVLAAIVLITFIAAIPFRYQRLAYNASLFIDIIEPLNLAPQPFVIYFIALDVISALGFIAIAAFIFWRKHNDGMTVLVSLCLLMAGAAFAFPLRTLAAEVPSLRLPIGGLQAVGLILFMLLFFIFPDGRFVPRWTRYLAALQVLAGVGWFFMPQFAETDQTLAIGFVIALVNTAIGIAAQIYRYRNDSTPVERQQTKWVLYGFIAPLVVLLIVALPMPFIPVREPTLPTLVYWVSIVPIAFLGPLLVPITIAVSILRYKLWDIDFVINRSILYSVMVIVLGAIFATAFFTLRTALELILRGDYPTIAVMASTATVVGLFQPTQSRLRRLIDRRLYGIELNYQGMVVHPPTNEPVIKPGEARMQFGKYTDLYLLGRGGMGEVYCAQHPTLNRMDAIKILPAAIATNPELRARFEREAQTTARLSHPNIVRTHDFGDEGGVPYMVMEYIEGMSLSDRLKHTSRLPASEATAYLQEIAAALDYAHREGVVHRDIKPGNVMLKPRTESGSALIPVQPYRAILTDFGIARIADATTLTTTGIVGTLEYIAPEQIQGLPVDGRADVYSLGIMAFQMLTGELPFRHQNAGALLLAHLQQPPPDPVALVPDLDLRVSAAIQRAMSKRPEHRYPTAGRFAADLCWDD